MDTNIITKSLQVDEIKNKINKAVLKGDFKSIPTLGEVFLTKMGTLASFTSDNKLYAELKEFLNANSFTLSTKDFTDKAYRRLSQVSEISAKFNKYWSHEDSYLDFGCGNGIITERIARNTYWKYAYGVDVVQQRSGFNGYFYDEYDGTLPYEDDKFDLITCFTVLHHSQSVGNDLKEMYGVLKPGGLLLIREFDAPSYEDKLFNYVMDELLYKVYTDNPLVPVSFNGYFSKETWNNLFINLGFQIMDTIIFDEEKDNPYKPFITVLTKT